LYEEMNEPKNEINEKEGRRKRSKETKTERRVQEQRNNGCI